MPGKCRPSLRKKTLDNVMCSNLSQTDKDCIKAVFERYVEVVRCGECYKCDKPECPMNGSPGRVSASDFCPYGEKEKR